VEGRGRAEKGQGESSEGKNVGKKKKRGKTAALAERDEKIRKKIVLERVMKESWIEREKYRISSTKRNAREKV